jgi:hypothetical protein
VSEMFSPCGHNAYWMGTYNTCMACRIIERWRKLADEAESELSAYGRSHDLAEFGGLVERKDLLRQCATELEAAVFGEPQKETMACPNCSSPGRQGWTGCSTCNGTGMVPTEMAERESAALQSRLQASEGEVERLKYKWESETCPVCNYMRSPVSPCKCGQSVRVGTNDRLRAEITGLKQEIDGLMEYKLKKANEADQLRTRIAELEKLCQEAAEYMDDKEWFNNEQDLFNRLRAASAEGRE